MSTVMPMAKKTDAAGNGENGTRQIRVFKDLADMLSDLAGAINEETANIVDPILRPAIVKKCKEHEPAVSRFRKAREEKAAAKEFARRQNESGE